VGSDGFFYNLGRLAGPAVRKGAWFWRSLTGTEAQRIAAERAVGRDLADAVLRDLPLDEDAAARTLLSEVGAAVAARVRDKRRQFDFFLAAPGPPNAFALPGGFVVATRALLDLVGGERDELAFILGHEVAHVIREDPVERIMTDATVGAALRAAPAGRLYGAVVSPLAARFIQSAYSQDREFAADELGVRLARAAGFDPAGAVRMLFRLADRAPQREGALAPYFSTHPPFAQRIREIRRLAPS
jgi:Zn-dependent protease with chaperone function